MSFLLFLTIWLVSGFAGIYFWQRWWRRDLDFERQDITVAICLAVGLGPMNLFITLVLEIVYQVKKIIPKSWLSNEVVWPRLPEE